MIEDRILLVGALVITLLSYGCSSEQETERDAKCIHNMKAILYDGLRKYCADHDQKYPNSLSLVYDKKYIDNINTFSLEKGVEGGKRKLNKQEFDAMCAYIYAGAGKRYDGIEDMRVILADKYENHNEVVHIIFSNGMSVEFRKRGNHWRDYCKSHSISSDTVEPYMKTE